MILDGLWDTETGTQVGCLHWDTALTPENRAAAGGTGVAGTAPRPGVALLCSERKALLPGLRTSIP